MNEKSWYVISTAGVGNKAVTQVQAVLESLEYEGMVWVPSKKDKITRYNKEQNSDKPLFPGYVFIYTYLKDDTLEQALIEAKIGKFLHYPGQDDFPAKISEKEIQHVKELEEVDSKPSDDDLLVVEPGNVVEICAGPMIGFKGIVTKVVDHDVYIETLIFGRSAPVRINIAHLTKLVSENEEKKAE